MIIKKNIRRFHCHTNDSVYDKAIAMVRYAIIMNENANNNANVIIETLKSFQDEDLSVSPDDLAHFAFKKTDFELIPYNSMKRIKVMGLLPRPHFIDGHYYFEGIDGEMYNISFKQTSFENRVISDVYIEKALKDAFPNGIYSKQKNDYDKKILQDAVAFCKAHEENGAIFSGGYSTENEHLLNELFVCEFVQHGNAATTAESLVKRGGVYKCLGFVTESQKKSYYASLSGNHIGGGKYAR